MVKRKKTTVSQTIKNKTEELVSVIKDITNAHPICTGEFIVATLLTILGLRERGFGGVALLSIAFPFYCISFPILWYSFLIRLLPKEQTTKVTRHQNKTILHICLWFLISGILSGTSITLLISGLSFIFTLLTTLDYIGMLFNLLTVAICVLIIFATNHTYLYFNKKSNKSRTKNGKK